MQLRDLLDLTELRLIPLTGDEGLDRPIRWVVTTDMLDPGRYLAGDELVLTGLVWRRHPKDSERFVTALAAAGVSGLAAGDAALGTIPDDLIQACRRHRVPLFEVPVDVAFATVTETVVRRVSAQRAGDLATVLDRHRRLLAGGELGAILDLVSRDLGLGTWVLTATGRQIAGSVQLGTVERERLAREFLRAPRLPAPVQGFTLVAVAGGPRIADWCLAIESDVTGWPAERRRLLDELVALVGAERDQLARRGRHPLAAELLQLILAGASADEFLPQLRACGLAPDAPCVVVVAHGATPDVLEEVLHPIAPDAVIAAVGPFAGASAGAGAGASAGVGAFAAASAGAGAFAGAASAALVPYSHGPVSVLVDAVRAAVNPLAAGLGNARLHIGVSNIAAGARGLRGAVEEARYGCQLAALRPGPAVVIGDDELSSHLLLLGGVSDDLRNRFRDRVLGAIDEYDRAHRSDLIPTLRTFLDCSGSWTKAAELLHVHVNTLRYRIARIEELTDRDLSTFADRVDLFLALQLR